MSFDSKGKLVELINNTNEISLTQDDIVFGTVKTQPDSRSVTKIVAAEGSGYRGGVTLRYNRINLGSLFGFFQPKINADAAGSPSVDWLLAKVAELYGVEIPSSDVVVSRKTTEEGDFFLVDAKDTSYYYSSSAEFQLVFDQIEITTLIGESTDNYVYPTSQSGELKIDGLVYSGGWAIPEATLSLSEFLVGQTVDEDLMWLTQTLSGDDWCLDPSNPQDFNLAESLVEYNGPTSDFSPEPDQAVTLLNPPNANHVLVLKVSETMCSNLAGFLTFYY